MTETVNLGLPFIDGSQAQKHVTHNEALRILDDAIQIAVLDTTLTVPSPSPVDGERHIVASGATGAWAGQGNAVATWETNAWRFLAPKAGWCVWSIADDALLVFDGSAWAPITTGASTLDNVPSMGINAAVAESNLLTVRSNDALLNAIDTADGGTGDVRLQLSKEAAGNTSSVVFSDAFSGRAEFGLTGDDDFHLKVSADGTSWSDALRFDRTTGRVSFPSGGAREVLAANRTYYIRTDGSNSNDGLSNTSGGAFLTIQKAIDVVAALDCSIYDVSIAVGAGTYSPIALKSFLGAGKVTITGDTTTPSNVVLASTSSDGVAGSNVIGRYKVEGFKFTNATSGSHIKLFNTYLELGTNEYAGATVAHVWIEQNAYVEFTASYTISGGATRHLFATTGGIIVCASKTVTLTGTPAFSSAFVLGSRTGVFNLPGNTYSGSATGARYVLSYNAIADVAGAGANYLPGNSAGSTAFGGQYA
jgi:predicted RecA/RadA family phage recombinase